MQKAPSSMGTRGRVVPPHLTARHRRSAREAANGANRMRLLGSAFLLTAHGGFSQGFGEGDLQPTATPL